MPVARIYASLVEEAEPICADLLARGYNVEVVFPDAVPTNPADLELRVERCSAEQAIARVEQGGSSSRCVFVMPAKGPRRELLLVEMTVLATGTDGLHPMAMPGIALVADHQGAVPLAAGEVLNADPGLAEVLPFPVLPLDAPAEKAHDETVVPRGADVAQTEQAPPRGYEKEQNLNKNLIAELNAFLAHAPVVKRPEGLHVRILENVRHSVSVERARKNWEGLTLAGIAAGFIGLLALGWFAAPGHSQPQSQSHATNVSPARISAAVAKPEVTVPTTAFAESRPSASTVNLRPVVLETRTSAISAPRPSRTRAPRRPLVENTFEDTFIAQDHVVNRSARRIPGKTAPAAATTSELVRPAGIRGPVTQSAPIKIITDLK